MSAVASGALAAALLLAADAIHPAFAWLVCAPLFALVAAPAGTRPPWLRGGLAGATFAVLYATLAHGPWLAEAARRYFSLPPVAAASGAALLTVGCGLVLGAVLGLLLACALVLPPAAAVVAYGAVWAIWEESLLIVFPSYPWVALAATQSDLPAVVQTASVAGQAGLSFVVALTGAALGHVLACAARRRIAWRSLGFAALLAAVVVAGGVARLHLAPATDGAACSIVGVDARVESGDLTASAAFERHAAATEPLLTPKPDVVVWPESALPTDPQLDPPLSAALRAWAERHDVVLIAGAPRTAWSAAWTEQRYNSLFRVARDRALQSYDKRVPVPLAERWPWPSLDPPAALRVAEVAAGVAPGLLQAGRCTLGVLICFEAERPRLARELALSGADALVIASNDAPLPERAVVAEERQARLRAVETGLPVLRVANAGGSVALDRYGRSVPQPRDGVALAVGEPRRLAPATRWAGSFLVLCAAATVCVVLSALLVRR